MEIGDGKSNLIELIMVLLYDNIYKEYVNDDKPAKC